MGEELFWVSLTDGSEVPVYGYGVMDAEQWAIQLYGNRFVSIGKHRIYG